MFKLRVFPVQDRLVEIIQPHIKLSLVCEDVNNKESVWGYRFPALGMLSKCIAGSKIDLIENMFSALLCNINHVEDVYIASKSPDFSFIAGLDYSYVHVSDRYVISDYTISQSTKEADQALIGNTDRNDFFPAYGLDNQSQWRVTGMLVLVQLKQ